MCCVDESITIHINIQQTCKSILRLPNVSTKPYQPFHSVEFLIRNSRKVWISWNLIWVDGRRSNGISRFDWNFSFFEFARPSWNFIFVLKFIWPGKIGRFAISYAFNYETFVSSEFLPSKFSSMRIAHESNAVQK